MKNMHNNIKPQIILDYEEFQVWMAVNGKYYYVLAEDYSMEKFPSNFIPDCIYDPEDDDRALEVKLVAKLIYDDSKYLNCLDSELCGLIPCDVSGEAFNSTDYMWFDIVESEENIKNGGFKMKNELSYEIVNHIGNIGEASASGWKKELNIVSWNGDEPKYDIRKWSEDHSRMSKGICLTESEMKELLDLVVF